MSKRKKIVGYIALGILGISIVMMAGCTTDETGAAGIQWWGVILAVVIAFVMFRFFGHGRKK